MSPTRTPTKTPKKKPAKKPTKSPQKKKSRPETAKPMQEPEPKYAAQRQQPPGLERELDPQPRWKGERYKPAGKLKGQVAVVTGGDSGIGRSVAYHFAREGADVVITCLPEESPDARETRKAIEEVGRKCAVYEGDLTEKAFCDEIVDRTIEEFGRLDILVHNAAWQNRKNIESLAEDELDRTIKTNVYACLRLARAAVPRLRPGATIITTGSVVGIKGSDRLSDYGATKGAIHAITKCLASELADRQIRVNCVAPGPVWTPLNPADTGLEPEDVAQFGEKNTQGRPAQPEEIAPAFVYLASNADSSFVTGAIIPITGHPV